MTSNQGISPRAQEAEQILAREGRASRAMIADALDVGGPRASELINQLLDANRATRVDTGLYEHEFYNHHPVDTDPHH